MAPLVRTGGSRHTGLAALPHHNIHRIYATPSIEMLGEAMNTANSTIPDETPEWEENENELAHICELR